MHQDKALEIAREAAVFCGERHDYMPPTPLLAEVWNPHRWVIDAMLLAAHVAEQERDSYKRGNTHLLGLLMQFCAGTVGTEEDAVKTLRDTGLMGADGSMNWQALKDREPKQQTWEEAVRECVTDPTKREQLLALDDDATEDEVHAALAPLMHWHPIQTAPMGREDLHLWTPSGQLVGYTYDRKRWYASGVKASDEGCDVELYEAPTHWMPVPADPAGAVSTLA